MTFLNKEEQKRAERNGRLIASDWTQVADAPVDRAAWAAYRQALRDLPQAANWPEVEIPNPPGYIEPTPEPEPTPEEETTTE